jgi:hypothetical protein
MTLMGKLIEKLHAVTQASSSGMGFLSPSRAPERKARPAALLAMGGAGDTAALRAAIENGADGVILSGWSNGATVAADLVEVVSKREGVWGVALEEGYAPGALKAAQEAGASFAVLAQGLPASALLEEIEKFDLVVAIEPPPDDLALLSLRAVNLLPVQAVLVDARFTASDLSRMSITDFTRLRIVAESLVFPTLVTLQGAPGETDTRTLIQLGADALVLSAAGASASAMTQQVPALIAELERTPARHESESGPLLAGLLGASGHTPSLPGPSPRPRPDRPERPEPEPDEE